MAQPTERTWIADENQEEIPEGWEIDGDPQVYEGDDIAVAWMDADAILRRLGGALIVTALRKELAPGIFKTTGLAFAWKSYGGPAQKLEDNGDDPETS